MQSLLELAPLVAFFIAYYAANIYVATAVLMAAMGLLLAVDYLRTRRIPPMHALSAALVFVFGTATLALHNTLFIRWKPTVFYWLAGVAFLASTWIGEKPLAQRLFAPALGQKDAEITRVQWRRLNGVWVVFCAALGALNLAVAFNASEQAWVYLHSWGFMIVTFVFIAVQFAWLAKRAGIGET